MAAPLTDDLMLKRIRAEHRIALKHLGPKGYADLLGVTVPQLNTLIRQAGSTGVVRWSVLSDEVLRAAFDDFIKGREIATRFCSRHGYSASGFTATLRERWPEEWEQVTGEKRPEAGRLYKMGRDLERRTRLKLMAAGYFVVRSPASKSKVDLTAVRNGEVLLIQCKRNGVIPKDEWNELVDIAEMAGAKPIIVENPHAGRTNWWEITGKKVVRGDSPKVPFPPPVEVRQVDESELDDDEECDDAA